MKLKTIRQIKKLFGKRVLVRVDFNVPIKDGKIIDDYKIRKSLATIKYLSKSGAKVILISHLGRPKTANKKLSLKMVSSKFAKELGKKIKFLKWVSSKDYFKQAWAEIDKMKNGSILMLENVRFLQGETEENVYLSKQFAEMADIFVIDGFGVLHRQGSSITGVAKLLPTYAGFLVEEELRGLSKALIKPKKPLILVLGGAKIETKLPILKKFLPIADKILIGGGIANTFLWANGYKIGSSIVDKNFKKEIKKLSKNKKIIIPLDVIVGQKNGKNAKAVMVDKRFSIKDNQGIYDIGPHTIREFAKQIKNANVLIWNGAMGLFETHPYEYGTRAMARLFSTRSKGHAFGIAGGGETIESIKELGLLNEIDLVSTGGGAMLEFLSGTKLLGIKKLLK